MATTSKSSRDPTRLFPWLPATPGEERPAAVRPAPGAPFKPAFRWGVWGGAPVLELRVGEGKERVPAAAEASGGTRGRGLVRERAESKSSFSERENAARSWEQPPALPPSAPSPGALLSEFQRRQAQPRQRAPATSLPSSSPRARGEAASFLLATSPRVGSPPRMPRLGGPLPDARGNNELQLATVDLWAIYTRLGGGVFRSPGVLF